jgi:hypothetical protein
MMGVAEKFKNSNLEVFDFSKSTLYLLADSSTPESARTEAIEKAESGETVNACG